MFKNGAQLILEFRWLRWVDANALFRANAGSSVVVDGRLASGLVRWAVEQHRLVEFPRELRNELRIDDDAVFRLDEVRDLDGGAVAVEVLQHQPNRLRHLQHLVGEILSIEKLQERFPAFHDTTAIDAAQAGL
jgi:hypothetical protein